MLKVAIMQKSKQKEGVTILPCKANASERVSRYIVRKSTPVTFYCLLNVARICIVTLWQRYNGLLFTGYR